MTVKFKSPPLVEILAEVRWDIGASNIVIGSGESVEIVTKRSADDEAHYFHLAKLLEQDGYNQVLRIAPMPTPYRPAIRFKRATEPTLYQVGPGMFSANSTPPYKSWEDFRPFAARGFAHLLSTRRESERGTPFFQVTLRYIDAFRESLMIGLKPREFMRDVLGFDFTLPAGTAKFASRPEAVEPNLRFQFESKKCRVSTACAWGASGNDKAVIWDTEVSGLEVVPPELDAVMRVLDEAHGIIHEMFVSATTKIHSTMEVEQ